MSWTNRIEGLLKQYATPGGAAAQPAPDAHAHFDEVSQAVPPGTLAEGIAAAFRSDNTPALGQTLAKLFSQSNSEQKAGLLNHLISSVNPAMLTQILSATGMAGMLSGGTSTITASQAQQITPEVVEQLANHAEKTNPSIIDSLSNFYAQHTTLVKTLGSGALTIALAKIAERQKQAQG
jgi:predicted DNA repair protein MutK